MQPPPEPSQPDPPQIDPLREFSLSLREVERSLIALKERYTQVQHDLRRQAQLRQRFDQVNKELRKTQVPITLKVELRRIKEQLEALEINLESQLFSWDSLKEPFWQAVRFGGLGVVVGWILKSCAR